MPSSSAHSRDRRDRRRTSHLPKLDIPDEAEEAQSPSPRSELLSPTFTDRQRSHSDQGHGSSSRKHKRHDGRSSHKQSSGQSSHRKRGTDKSSASHRELVDTIAHSDDLDRQLHKTLEATVRRLEEEARKARDLERVTKETAQKFMEVNESRLTAQKEASEASRALREEQLRLEEAQKEIERARAMVKDLARQKEEAEQSAARARAKARKLQQRQLVMQAREEGRKMGFEAGIKQAQEEYDSVVPYEPSTRSRRHRHRSPTPPPEGGTDDDDDDDDDDDGFYEEGDTMRTDDIRSPGPQPHPQPVVVPLHPPQPPPAREQLREVSNAHLARAVSPAPTFPVEKFEVDIPPADEIVNAKKQPREEWVTAQKHREMTGAETTPRPTPIASLRDNPNISSMPEPNFTIHPDLARQVQESGQPMMIYPHGQQPGLGQFPQPMYQQGAAPPNSGAAKKTRFPSLAKTKSKAASWYRSFSLRRKNRPVIDPDDEEEPSSAEPLSAGPQSAGIIYAKPGSTTRPNGIVPIIPGQEDDEEEDPRMYQYQPKPAQKWYVPSQAKSVKSRHSRMPSGAPDHRHSVASTRISQLDMVNSAPRGYHGDGASISGKSTMTRSLAQKLSVIQEDPMNRASAGSKYVGGVAGYGAPIPAPNFAATGSEVGSTRTGRRRPPGITVQNPNGLANSAVQMGQGNSGHLAPPLAHTSSALTRSTSTSGEINIDVQPATAAPIRSAGVPRNMTQTHLTPNYQPVYAQSTASRRSRQSTHGGGHRIAQSYSEPPQAQPQSDAPSMRSGHSRSQSAQAETGPYPPELVPKSTQSVYKSSRDGPSKPPGNAPYGINSAGSTSQFLDVSSGNVVHRSPSRSSMHSKYNPETYLDPAYFAINNEKGKGKATRREPSRSPGLEYVDP
ncbi:hypothetical protein BKA70DRAFT_1399259 [Coprinopsis sp. MPI-PUGE-AT-0042]|nr:hypothetical protein BKA70DRAFT_1399259 [Coprinopsis sp. MPI-PUGE-AT-0042]